MFKDIKKLRKLLKLQESGETQMRFDGYTPEGLKNAIKHQRDKLAREINYWGWFIVFLIFVPIALIKLFRFSFASASIISLFSAAIIFIFILPKITGRSY